MYRLIQVWTLPLNIPTKMYSRSKSKLFRYKTDNRSKKQVMVMIHGAGVVNS